MSICDRSYKHLGKIYLSDLLLIKHTAGGKAPNYLSRILL